jgi:Zn-dependent protease with chaperone function
MRRVCLQLIVVLFAVPALTATIVNSQTKANSGSAVQPAAPTDPTQTAAPAANAAQKITAYTLPPDRYQKAHTLSRLAFRFLLISFCYEIIVLWLILRLKIGARYRTWAEKFSARSFLQALIFAPCLLLTIALLELPAGIYRHSVSSSYGLSIQNWPSWFWDWTKAEFFILIGGTFFIWLLYLVIRKSPRRWWFYFWLVSLPIGLAVVFAIPIVVDPTFNKFEPLSAKDPALTDALQKMVHRGGEEIPPERMFWMGAGEKTTTLNAYVAGFGASKRIVVWDTTIARLTTPEITYIAGHEMGHYTLNHIPKGLALGALSLLLAFYLGFRCLGWAVDRCGTNWGVRGIDDWASLPILLLLFSLFLFVSNPLANAVSRYLEHQADQYGLEVTHGLTPDSGQVAAQAFQTMGDIGLADPDPNPVYVFMYFDHPPIRDRVQFCLSYDPWSSGQQPAFVK